MFRPPRLRIDERDIETRLHQLGLEMEGLRRVAQAAVYARNDVTANDPQTAAGWDAWRYGIRVMRETFCGEEWRCYRKDGVEGIVNHEKKIRVLFMNVDKAADKNISPRACSPKGIAVQRAAVGQPTLFPEIFPELEEGEEYETWFLMVEANGDQVCAELSMITEISGKSLEGFIERIFIARGEMINDFEVDNIEDEVVEFDIEITRKQ